MLHWNQYNHFVNLSETKQIHHWREPAEMDQGTNMNSLTRMLCGSLILPTVATIAGKLLFGRIQSNFQRSLLVCSFKSP